MKTFRNIKELLQVLHKEERLLSVMFSQRKSIDYKWSDALDLLEDETRIERLITMAVLNKNVDILEIEDVFLEFFEQVLSANEEINLSYIDENIQNIKDNIDYFLNEHSERQKYSYLKRIKKAFRNMGLTTSRSVVDLRRNIENTFKNEANYKNKKLKLENFDKKRTTITSLITQTLLLVDEEAVTFFNRVSDEDLNRTVMDLKYNLGECWHNLIEIQKQIIAYLNQIKHLEQFSEKIRRLKYLKDRFTIEAETNIKEVLSEKQDVIFETKTLEPLPLSLDFLRADEKAFDIIKKVAQNHKKHKDFKPKLAEKISEEYLDNTIEEEVLIDLQEIKNKFISTSENLFNFILNYDFTTAINFDERVTVFCQVVSRYEDELMIKDEFQTCKGIEYAVVVSK